MLLSLTFCSILYIREVKNESMDPCEDMTFFGAIVLVGLEIPFGFLDLAKPELILSVFGTGKSSGLE